MDIEVTLREFIVNELLNGSTDVNRTDNLLADGMVDSLGMLRLVTYIENLLDIKIPHSDLVIDNFRNIEVISQYLLQRKSA